MINEEDYIELLKILDQYFLKFSRSTLFQINGTRHEANGLVMKFYGHVSSALNVYKFIHYQGFGLNSLGAYDISSINVLSRSALETLLVFYKIFISPHSIEEAQFNYKIWIISGLKDRQNFATSIPDIEGKLKKEKKLLDQFQKEIETNPIFKTLTKRQKERQKKYGDWRFTSWKDLSIEAGFSERSANSIYCYLSGYAHSGNIGILQITQANNANIQKDLCGIALKLNMVCMAKMLSFCCKKSQELSKFLQLNQEARKIIRHWEGFELVG